MIYLDRNKFLNLMFNLISNLNVSKINCKLLLSIFNQYIFQSTRTIHKRADEWI